MIYSYRRVSTDEIIPLPDNISCNLKVVMHGDFECWEWTAWKDKDGYGVYWYNNKLVRLTRFIFELAYGRKPGACVRHKCDNKPCFRPEHLVDGTHQDNSDDAVLRGIMPKGEENGNARLKQDEVDAIRDLYRELRIPQRTLAKMFGVSQFCVGMLLKNLTWRKDGGVIDYRHIRRGKAKK
jgi:hypothetical protein